MVNEIDSPWPSEPIPDEDLLYMRVFHTFVKKSYVSPRIFENKPLPTDGMSTDWGRYSTPSQTRARGRKPPEKYHIIKMVVGEIRKIKDQSVKHTPDWINQNQAHTDVLGSKDDEEVRVMFGRIAKLIPLTEIE